MDVRSQLHVSHLGFLCPVETPEGPACGLIKAFSIGARVTQQPNPEPHKQHRLYVLELLRANTTGEPGGSGVMSYVFYNGEILGRTNKATQLVAEIQLLSIGDQIHEIVSAVVTFDGHLYVNTDEGRVVRPLLSAKWWTTAIRPAEQGICVDDLIQTGGVRYVDAAECGAFDIAWTPDILAVRTCDFLEIHPNLMLGVTAACIPFLPCPGSHSHTVDEWNADPATNRLATHTRHPWPARHWARLCHLDPSTYRPPFAMRNAHCVPRPSPVRCFTRLNVTPPWARTSSLPSVRTVGVSRFVTVEVLSKSCMMFRYICDKPIRWTRSIDGGPTGNHE